MRRTTRKPSNLTPDEALVNEQINLDFWYYHEYLPKWNKTCKKQLQRAAREHRNSLDRYIGEFIGTRHEGD
nr:hypothetical protein [Candidatus Sigynarchaeota archaeon]